MPIETLLPLAGAWLWSSYGKNLADKIFHAGKEKWDASRWDTAATAYREKIIKRYDSMQIMGMAEPVPLDDIFTEAYMLDKPTAFGRFDIERLKQLSTDPKAPPPDVKRINGLKLVVENDRNLFILGKPGAGKTTFLKYIAVKAAEQTIDKVPIFVSLKQWSDSGKKLLEFIVEERFDVCGFPNAKPFVEELLKSGNAIVLFDGLDEVNQESGQRDKQTHEMNNFVEKYDRAQCLITCRIAASDYSFERFTYVEIADFTENQIKTFVGNWFRNKEGEKDEETCKKFLAEFKKEDNKGLRDLARTPLLLTLLCLAFNETLTFPQRRVELYEEAVDALLKRWDASRRIKRDAVYRKLSLGHKENMLARIAAETFEKNEYFIPQRELERHITNYVKNVPPHDTNQSVDGEAILKAIEAQHGIFVERARDVYSFSHLTFQEYLTAKYVVTNAAKGRFKNLVKTHCADVRWREVFLLTTSLLPDASQFMTTFQGGVDELLGGDEKLKALLKWADGKSISIQVSPRTTIVSDKLLLERTTHNLMPSLAGLLRKLSRLVRQYYLFIELYYESKSPDLNLNLNRARDIKLDLDRIIRFNLDYALGDDTLNLDLALYRDHNLALKLDRAPDVYLTNDLILTRGLALDLGLNELATELAALTMPAGKATAAEWQEFADSLRAVMIEHRDIGHKWDLTAAQERQLADYLNAIDLLQDCLELAFMPPDEKKAMLNSLYLPPADEGQNA